MVPASGEGLKELGRKRNLVHWDCPAVLSSQIDCQLRIEQARREASTRAYWDRALASTAWTGLAGLADS